MSERAFPNPSDRDRWEADNADALAAAVAWIRQRLSGLALSDDPPGGASATGRGTRAAGTSGWDEVLHPPGREGRAPSALASLCDRLALSRFEQQVLTLCAAAGLDTRTGALCASAQDDPAKNYPTFALALAALDDPAWESVAPDAALRKWRLIDIHAQAGQPLVAAPLRTDERVIHYLKGLNTPDERLIAALAPMPVDLEALASAGRTADDLPASQAGAVDAIVAVVEIGALASGGRLPAVVLDGPDAGSNRLVAAVAGRRLRVRVWRVAAEMLPSQASELDALLRLWQRETLLSPLALLLDARGVERSPEADAALRRFVEGCPGLVLIDSREPLAAMDRPVRVVTVAKPTADEQRREWVDVLSESVDLLNGDDDGVELASALAAQFDLGVTSIRRVRDDAAAGAGDATPLGERVWQACLRATRPRMGPLAQRIEPRAVWKDIVLPDEPLRLLRGVAEQVRGRGVVYDDWGFRDTTSRGLGITALFAGDSGTGKTLAAEVLASELKLDLYRIDLSSVVSKWIGETGKNLARLFDGAEDGGALLFFDEADALFGKRSEVRDSHDRYANVEIDYLLQRMEAYRGLAVLATNQRSALDAAFLRRLRFVIEFPFPGPNERRAIWQRAFPPRAPLADDIDWDRLARLNLAGGSIHNAALGACFIAAGRDRASGQARRQSVTMALILDAAREEYRKLERPINEAEFDWEAGKQKAAPANASRRAGAPA